MLVSYSQECNGVLPPAHYIENGWYPQWNQVLGDETSSIDISSANWDSRMFGRDYARCPLNNLPVDDGTLYWYPKIPLLGTYAVHYDYLSPPVSPFHQYGNGVNGSLNLANVNPAAFMVADGSTSFFYNANQFPFTQDTDGDGVADTNSVLHAYCNFALPCHFGGVNVLFGDMSVSHVKLDKFLKNNNQGWAAR